MYTKTAGNCTDSTLSLCKIAQMTLKPFSQTLLIVTQYREAVGDPDSSATAHATAPIRRIWLTLASQHCLISQPQGSSEGKGFGGCQAFGLC